MNVPAGKRIILISIIAVYLLSGIAFYLLIENGVIPRVSTSKFVESIEEPPKRIHNYAKNLVAAENFFSDAFLRSDGHVFLEVVIGNRTTRIVDSDTNSEAISYAMLNSALRKDKETFDLLHEFVQTYMLHPEGNYLMWRLTHEGVAEDDGSNIASDADLRMIKALVIAEQQWEDLAYTQTINTLAQGLETVAITENIMLAPYGGMSGESAWTASEVWLSYSDFTVFRELAERRGEPWTTLFTRMKEATLQSQIEVGLYNSQITEGGDYGNDIDGGHYSITSLWIMVRSAESNDPRLEASAQQALEFYKRKFEQDNELYGTYTSSGDAINPYDAVWVYALVGRTAIALDDEEFASAMMQRLSERQIMESENIGYGAFAENQDLHVTQFTQQEAITTLIDYSAYQKKKDAEITKND